MSTLTFVKVGTVVSLLALAGCGQSPYRVVCNSNDPELVGEYESFADAKAVQHETGAAMVCRGA